MSNLRHAAITWTSGLVFTGGVPDGPQITLDGDGIAGPSPLIALLLAAAGCSATDVVPILEKMRVTLLECRVEITGTRREQDPKRFIALHLVYHLRGTGLDEVKARRAIDLSNDKYCSVIHSLAPDIPITYDVRLG